MLIQSLSSCLHSLLVMGTSLMQKILREGVWSIFLTVPEVDLNTESVIICSSFRFSWLRDKALIE